MQITYQYLQGMKTTKFLGLQADNLLRMPSSGMWCRVDIV
jgi:hypothetical protein